MVSGVRGRTTEKLMRANNWSEGYFRQAAGTTERSRSVQAANSFDLLRSTGVDELQDASMLVLSSNANPAASDGAHCATSNSPHHDHAIFYIEQFDGFSI